jgi:hypothetical protein
VSSSTIFIVEDVVEIFEDADAEFTDFIFVVVLVDFGAGDTALTPPDTGVSVFFF